MRIAGLICSLFFLFNTCDLDSQSHNANFPTINYGIKDGLLSNRCLATVQDNFGYIWIATDQGVFRNNGNKCEALIEILNNYSIDEGLNAESLFIDSENNLWIGTYGQGLYKYNIQRNDIIKIKGDSSKVLLIDQIRIYGMHEPKKGILRFTGHGLGLIDFYIKKDSISFVNLTSDQTWIKELSGFQLMVRPIFDKENTVIDNWYSSLAGLVEYVHERDTFIYHSPLSHRNLGIRGTIQDEKGIIWTANYSEGIYSYNKSTGEWKNYRCKATDDSFTNCLNAASINVYNDSTLIIGTDEEGLYFLNTHSGDFKSFEDIFPNISLPLSANEIKWYDNILWISSLDNGLYAHNPKPFSYNTIFNSEKLGRVIYDAGKGAYIISYSNTPYFKILKENKEEKIIILPSFNKSEILNWIERDDQNRLWFASESNLFFYDLRAKKFNSIFVSGLQKPSLQNFSFRRIINDNFGNLWASSQDGNLLKLDLKTLKVKIYEKSELSHSYSNYIDAVDEKGQVYFKSGSGGFFAYDPTKNGFTDDENLFDEYGNKFKMPAAVELCLEENKLYVAGNISEYYCLKSGKLEGQIVTKKSSFIGMLPLKVLDMMIFKEKLWMTTKEGLASIDLNNGDEVFYGSKEGFYDLKNISNGPDGTILVTTNYNIYIINPDKLQIQKSKNQLVSHSIIKHRTKTNDTLFFPKDKIVMEPKDLSMTINFDNINFGSKENKQYSIKINKGNDGKWQDLGYQNKYYIQNMPGGSYEIYLRSKLKNERDWSEPTMILHLDIIVPLLKRPIFWISLIALAILLIWLYIKWRLKLNITKQEMIIAFNKQIAETEMKALRAQMNPHFLFNVLNAIKLNIQKNEQTEAISFITDFSKLIRAVLHNSSKSSINLAEELEILDIYIKIEKKRFSTEFSYSIKVDDDVDLTKIKIPPLVLQPYVENAIWHGLLHKTNTNGLIDIHISKTESGILISILDNGIGREKAKLIKSKSANQNKSLGMKITKDRIDINNQLLDRNKISVCIVDLYKESEPQGTKVEVRIDN